ncbi:hypothetical protein OAX78_03180, partial [Planctomycetota bacterium]|nr:hypothetical protein [Planctomycetota bacterium]
EAGEVVGMLADCTAVLEVDADSVRALLLRGYARTLHGDPRGAVVDCDRALALATQVNERVTALNNRGIAWVLSGDFELAKADFRAVLAERSNHDHAQLNLGMVFALEEDWGAARQRFQKAGVALSRTVRPRLWLWAVGGEDRLGGFIRADDELIQVAAACRGAATVSDVLDPINAMPAGPERRRRLCDAHGFLGLKAERESRLADAKRHYQACVDTGVIDVTVAFWARVRLQHLRAREE